MEAPDGKPVSSENVRASALTPMKSPSEAVAVNVRVPGLFTPCCPMKSSMGATFTSLTVTVTAFESVSAVAVRDAHRDGRVAVLPLRRSPGERAGGRVY